MVTIVSHISDYFEQFNSSLTAGGPQAKNQSSDISASNHKIPLTFYVFDFERYSDEVGTLRDLRMYMIRNWHNSFFYAFAYLFLIYGKLLKMRNFSNK